MSQIKGFNIGNGNFKYDYNALENKTQYVKDPVDLELLNTTLEKEDDGKWYYIEPDISTQHFRLGDKCKIYINGVLYETAVNGYKAYYGGPIAGNVNLVMSSFENTGEPISITLQSIVVTDEIWGESTSITVVFYVEYSEVVVLDEKFTANRPGRITSFKEFEIDGETVVASEYAEVFGDLDNNIAAGLAAHAEGGSTVATDQYTHAEGCGTKATGPRSHAEGLRCIASSGSSHAEGQDTVASGINSHAEGAYSKAEGNESHVEGDRTRAVGLVTLGIQVILD